MAATPPARQRRSAEPTEPIGHLTNVVIIDNMPRGMGEEVRSIGWIRAARKAYEAFPPPVQDRVNTALTIAAQGSKADIAKPLKGLGAGVMEIAVRYRTDAWRVVYVTEIAGVLWVIHAFQKKSKQGIRTPKPEIDLVRSRLSRLREELAT